MFSRIIKRAIGYKPYPIYDMKSGVRLDKEPWLIPKDAFVELFNAYLYHGVLKKRQGYEEFARLVHGVSAEDLHEGDGSTKTFAGHLNGYYSNSGSAVWSDDCADDDTADFTLTDCTMALSSGTYTITETAATQEVSIAMSGLTVGAIYEFSIDVKDGTGANILCNIKATNNADDTDLATTYFRTNATSETRSVRWAATETTNKIEINLALGAGETAIVDNWSVYLQAVNGTTIRYNDVDINDGTETFTCASTGVLTGDAAGSGTLNLTTGAYTITLNAATAAGTDIEATYHYYPENEVMGIWELVQNNGTERLIAMDTKRLNRWDTTNEYFTDVSLSDRWTGIDDDFFWACNFNNKVYMTNNIDRVTSYDDTTHENLLMDTNGDLSNNVATCLLLFNYKERLVALRTTEDGTAYPQRARWSAAGGTDYSNGGYVDAPTEQFIIGAEFLGNDLIVFFERSIYALKYQINAKLPFIWVKIADTEGAAATFSIGAFTKELTALGPTGLIGTNGINDAYRIDIQIPDFTLNFASDYIKYCYNVMLDEIRQSWITYARIGQTYPDRLIGYNYEDKAYFTADNAFHCFGFWEAGADVTWEDDRSWEECEFPWGDKTLQSGYPITLGGDRSGYIYQMNSGGDDDGSAIESIVQTGRWNPFIEQGENARFGYLEFLAETDSNITLTFEFYKNSENDYYKTQDVVLTGTGEKKWFRITVGETGFLHAVKIKNNASDQTYAIHAMMPWFKPAGRTT